MKLPFKHIVLLLFVCIYGGIFAQKNKNLFFSITALVYDSLNNRPVPFAKVYNISNKLSTSTTISGTFRLTNILPKDSIVFYSFGFVKKIILGENLRHLDSVFLSPQTHVLDNVIVLGDKSILYDFISNAIKNRPTKRVVAKSYSEQKTFCNNDQIELIQGYYNTYYKGYDLENIKTINVRFGVRPKNKRVYASITASKAFYRHQLFEKNTLFPASPFNINKRNLRKKYHLFLNAKFKEGKKTIYVIRFSPIIKDGSLFYGKVWIDSLSNKIQKVILKANNARIYPFTGIFNEHSLSHVNLNIIKSFSHKNDTVKTNFINFDYSFNFKFKDSILWNIKTSVSLISYNYEEMFLEPFFEFPNYREFSHQLNELTVINYDSIFWNCMDEYKPSSNEYKNNLFYADSLTINRHEFFNTQKFMTPLSDSAATSGRYYIDWDKKNRIYIRDLKFDTSSSYNRRSNIPFYNYKLYAQIYLNIRNSCDSIYYFSKTFFDPFNTYYHYPINSKTMIFINIYFDIVEIQRRKLNIQLDSCINNISLMKKTYYKLLKETNEITSQYFNDVNRGRNYILLEQWNNYVKEHLGIDNMKIFSEEMQQR